MLVDSWIPTTWRPEAFACPRRKAILEVVYSTQFFCATWSFVVKTLAVQSRSSRVCLSGVLERGGGVEGSAVAWANLVMSRASDSLVGHAVESQARHIESHIQSLKVLFSTRTVGNAEAIQCGCSLPVAMALAKTSHSSFHGFQS